MEGWWRGKRKTDRGGGRAARDDDGRGPGDGAEERERERETGKAVGFQGVASANTDFILNHSY